MSILEIKNLNVYYKNTQVLHNINLSVNEGSITSIIGESGSGKTTLFKTILNIQKQSERISLEGEILFKKQSIIGKSESLIQPVFQDPSLYFHKGWSLEKCLLEPINIMNLELEKSKEKMNSLLEQFSLPSSMLYKKIENFSGGELQRISIIRALLTNPFLLLMDEPVSGLDRIVLNETVNYIKNLKKNQPITILIISHDLEFISKISEFVYVIQNGKIQEFGEPSQVFTNPSSEYTKLLINSRDLSDLRS